MSSDIKTGWEVDLAIEPMNTKLVRLRAEEEAEHYLEQSEYYLEQSEYYLEQAEHYATRSKVFVLFGTTEIESPGFLCYGLTEDNAALEAALRSIAYNVETLYAVGVVCVAKLAFDEEKSVAQVRALVDEACAAVLGINIQYIEAINSLQAPTI